MNKILNDDEQTLFDAYLQADLSDIDTGIEVSSSGSVIVINIETLAEPIEFDVATDISDIESAVNLFGDTLVNSDAPTTTDRLTFLKSLSTRTKQINPPKFFVSLVKLAATSAVNLSEKNRANLKKMIVIFLNKMVGESGRSIKDAGAYIPGSSKERSALRKVSVEEKKVVEVDLKSLVSTLSRGLTTVSSACYLNAKDADSLEIDIEHHIIFSPEILYFCQRLAYYKEHYLLPAVKFQNYYKTGGTKANVTVCFEQGLDLLIQAFTRAQLKDDLAAIKSGFIKAYKKKPSTEVKHYDSSALKKSLLEAAEHFRLGAKDDEQDSKDWADLRLRGLSKAFAQLLDNICARDQSEVEKTASQYARTLDYKVLLKLAAKQAKKMGDWSALDAAAKRSKFPEFSRTGGADTSAIDSPQKFVETFGLKAQQFGKSLSDKDRAELLARSSSALSDLKDVVGLDSQQVGMGQISLAVAARGKGGKNAATAHYEPKHKIINLARTGFDGSLSHEMGHAFDYGRDGVSFFDEAPDSDPVLAEALAELKRKLLTSDKAGFIENRRNEITDLRRKQKEAKATYDEGLKMARQLAEPFDKQITEKRALLDAYIKASKISQKELVLNDDDQYNQLSAELRQLQSTKATLFNAKLLSVEKYRIYSNRLISKVSDLQSIVRHSENGRQLSSVARFSKLLGSFPRDLIECFDDPERGISEFAWAARNAGETLGGRGIAYWASPKELFARAFESYVDNSLSKQGRNNNFLVDGDQLERCAKVGLYPNGKERAVITAALEDFFTVLKRRGYFSES